MESRQFNLKSPIFSGGYIAFEAFLAIGVAFFLFPKQVGLVSIFLLAFALLPLVNQVLDENRREIWEGGLSPVKANCRTLIQFLCLFLLVFSVYFSTAFFASDTVSGGIVSESFGKYRILEKEALGVMDRTNLQLMQIDFWSIFSRNIVVLAVVFLLSIIYSYGFILVFVWNGAYWGTVSSLFYQKASVLSEGVSLPGFFLAISGYVLLEASAYTSAAMSGLFGGRAFRKYKAKSEEFGKVIKAVVILLVIGLLLLVLSGIFEAFVSHKMLQSMLS